MTQQRRTALKELQKLDTRIQDARKAIHDFDPLFEEVEEPALILESELNTGRTRLKEMKLEERRLELAVEEKRERIRKLDERLGSVRNLREEAAVSAELDMVKRALQSDEQEALSLIDQVRKGEERVTELEAAFEEASELVEPKRNELLGQREEARADLASLEKDRVSFAGAMDPEELRIYDAIRGRGARAAVAELTDDGACGHCFGMVPLQHQNEVRHGEALIRCEACGVILAAPEPKAEGADEPPEEAAAEAGDSEETTEDAAAETEDSDDEAQATEDGDETEADPAGDAEAAAEEEVAANEADEAGGVEGAAAEEQAAAEEETSADEGADADSAADADDVENAADADDSDDEAAPDDEDEVV